MKKPPQIVCSDSALLHAKKHIRLNSGQRRCQSIRAQPRALFSQVTVRSIRGLRRLLALARLSEFFCLPWKSIFRGKSSLRPHAASAYEELSLLIEPLLSRLNNQFRWRRFVRFSIYGNLTFVWFSYARFFGSLVFRSFTSFRLAVSSSSSSFLLFGPSKWARQWRGKQKKKTARGRMRKKRRRGKHKAERRERINNIIWILSRSFLPSFSRLYSSLQWWRWYNSCVSES